MTYFPLLILLMATPQDQPATAPAASQPTTMAGPMRVELDALVETRYWFAAAPGERMRKPELRLRVKVAGNRLNQIVRVGMGVIFDEFVDDTGASLLTPTTYSEQDRKGTRLITERENVATSGLMLMSAVEPSTRGSKTIKRARGTVKVVYAPGSESITIENPLRFKEKMIEHPRLNELGITLRLLPPGEPPNLPPGGKFLAYEVLSNVEKVKDVGLYDAWMKRMRTTNRDMQTSAGKPCTVIQLDADLTESSQMVIEVFPQVEETSLPVEFSDVKLP